MDGTLIDHVGGGSPGGSLGKQGSDVEVARGVLVAPAGQGLGDAGQLQARLDAGERHFRRVAGGGPKGGPPGVGLRVRRLGQLQCGGEVRERRRVLVGQGEEPTGELIAPLERPRQEILVLGELGSPDRQRRDHPHEARAERRRDRRRAATAGHRLGRSEANDEVAERHVAEAIGVVRGWGHPPIVGAHAHAARRARAPRRGGRGTGAPAPHDAEWRVGGRATLSVDGGDRPAARSMLVGEGQARLRGLHLEQGARTGDHRVGGRLFAEGGEVRDR